MNDGCFFFWWCVLVAHPKGTKELDAIIEVCYNASFNELLVDPLAAKRSQHAHSRNQSLSGPVQAWRFRAAAKAIRQEVNASLPLTLSGCA